MNKEIEKYVWYYLSVYIVVLFIYGFFEYIAVCNGESLKCAFDGMKIKEALTITASVFTPVIAIFAYFSWKEQKKYDLKKEFLAKCLNDIDEIYSEKLSILLKLEVLRTISNEKAVIYRTTDLTNSYQEDIFLRALSNIESYNYVSEKKYDLDKIYIFQHFLILNLIQIDCKPVLLYPNSQITFESRLNQYLYLYLYFQEQLLLSLMLVGL